MSTSSAPHVDWEALRHAATAALARAYAPYSRFHVAAALQAEDGRVFIGVNVENASYGLTICAERNAVGAAIASGAQRFVALVVVASGDQALSPCGACRQVLAEFAPAFEVRCYSASGQALIARTDELLPASFRLERT